MAASPYVSPGVYTRELDFSLYVPQLTTAIFGIVTTATKGPTETKVLCSSEAQLVNSFGPPGVMNHGLHAGIEYLRQGNQLIVVRVAGYAEAFAGGHAVDTLDAEAITFEAVESGSWANGTAGMHITFRAGRMPNTYDVSVFWRGVVVETYSAVVITPSSDANFITTRMQTSAFCLPISVVGTTALATPQTVTFSGGNDGATTHDSDYIGETIGNVSTGLQHFASPEVTDVNLLAVPGIYSGPVVTQLISIAESRQDCLVLVDPPTGLGIQGIVDWHNGQSVLPSAPPTLNSSYAALYWSWVLAYDQWSQSNIYKPPSGYAAAAMAKTDRDYQTWFAPAGAKRGRLQAALDVEYSPSQGERDYINGGVAGAFGINRINPIVNFPGFGLTLYGQTTLLRSTTLLEEIGIRRGLLYLRKVIATAVRYLVFDQNDSRLWNNFKGLIDPYLRNMQALEGLSSYQIIMDASNNPPEVMAQKTAVGDILLVPVSSAEKIVINFNILPIGANFSEFLIPPSGSVNT